MRSPAPFAGYSPAGQPVVENESERRRARTAERGPGGKGGKGGEGGRGKKKEKGEKGGCCIVM